RGSHFSRRNSSHQTAWSAPNHYHIKIRLFIHLIASLSLKGKISYFIEMKISHRSVPCSFNFFVLRFISAFNIQQLSYLLLQGFYLIQKFKNTQDISKSLISNNKISV